MANDVRFLKPNTIQRFPGTVYLWTWLRYYGPSSTGLIELYAYDINGNALYYPFTDPNSIISATYSGQWNGSYYTQRNLNVLWGFKNMTLANQAVTFRCWLYSAYGELLDYVTA